MGSLDPSLSPQPLAPPSLPLCGLELCRTAPHCLVSVFWGSELRFGIASQGQKFTGLDMRSYCSPFKMLQPNAPPPPLLAPQIPTCLLSFRTIKLNHNVGEWCDLLAAPPVLLPGLLGLKHVVHIVPFGAPVCVVRAHTPPVAASVVDLQDILLFTTPRTQL